MAGRRQGKCPDTAWNMLSVTTFFSKTPTLQVSKNSMAEDQAFDRTGFQEALHVQTAPRVSACLRNAGPR